MPRGVTGKDKVDLRTVPDDKRPELPEYVKSQIYKITCKTTGQIYVGQTRSHIMNHGKYRPFGIMRRWNQHVTETKKGYNKQSRALNECITRYGEDDFTVELIEECPVNICHEREVFHINELKSYENGLNLTTGGKCGAISDRQKEMIRDTLKKHYADPNNARDNGKNHTIAYDDGRIAKIKEMGTINEIQVRYFTSEARLSVRSPDNKTYNSKFVASKVTTMDEVKDRIKALIDEIKQEDTKIIYV